jgi:hypothetical protein
MRAPLHWASCHPSIISPSFAGLVAKEIRAPLPVSAGGSIHHDDPAFAQDGLMVRLLKICTHNSSLAPREPESQTRGEDAGGARAGLWINITTKINTTLFARGKPVSR